MSPERVLVVALGIVLLATVWLAFGVWIWLDARARGSSHPVLWAVVVPFSGIFLLYYGFWWRRQHDRDDPPSRRERYAQVVAVAGLGGFLVAAFVAPPDPVTQLAVWPIAFAGCLPIAVWLCARTRPATGTVG